MDNKIPFPQANDFSKIVKLLSLDEEYFLDNDFVKECISVNVDRQVSYYLSALMYLGIIDKNKKYTKVGNRIKKLSNEMKKVELINLLLSDRVIRYVYSYEKVTSIIASQKSICSLIKELYPDYSNEIYKRRATTITAWVEWINDNTI